VRGRRIAKEKGEAQATAASAGGASYLVISPHTAEQCLSALDALAGLPNGKTELAHWDWGCMGGDHTGYRMVAAASDKEALALVPESVRGQAKAIKLTKFTVEQIESFHKMKH
jgi:hypothetical protein